VASPIYFHHLTAPLKKIIDRFRSFVHIRITETGLIHTPWQQWKKQLVLILSQGSPSPVDARPVEELFQFLHQILGLETPLIKAVGTRLAMVNQVAKNEEELRRLYLKLGLPDHLVKTDFQANRALLEKCYRLGQNLQ
jgi:NAD(P)H-dependent FMN reductase